MNTGSKTLLGPFLTGFDLIGLASWRSSKRSGALRLREGRLLGGGGGGAAFFTAGRFEAGFSADTFFGAGLDFPFAFAFGLDEAVAFLDGGEPTSWSSSRLRFLAMLEVIGGESVDPSLAAVDVVVALISGRGGDGALVRLLGES
tara:strand:- start:6613 stop:7047 length:435 start_codon:yes stop_codon:yes gene_type:complete